MPDAGGPARLRQLSMAAAMAKRDARWNRAVWHEVQTHGVPGHGATQWLKPQMGPCRQAAAEIAAVARAHPAAGLAQGEGRQEMVGGMVAEEGFEPPTRGL